MHPAITNDQQLRELALTVARNTLGANEPVEFILQKECLTAYEYEIIGKNPAYQRMVREFTDELNEKGFSFSAKCRVLAEDLIGDVYRMAKDSDTPAAMRVKTLENLVEWGLLKPKVAVTEANSGGYSITINLSPGASGAGAGNITLENVVLAPKITTISLPTTPFRPIRPLLDIESFLDDPWDEPYYEAEATACL